MALDNDKNRWGLIAIGVGAPALPDGNTTLDADERQTHVGIPAGITLAEGTVGTGGNNTGFNWDFGWSW